MRRPPLFCGLGVTLSAALALCMLSPGCKKNKQTEEAPPPAVSGLGAVPASAIAVVGIDVTRLVESSIAKRAIEQLYRRDKTLKVWAERVATECQIVPGKTVDSALLALNTSRTESLLIASGTFSEAHLAACVGKSLAADGGRLVTQASGPHTLYRTESGKRKSVVWFAVSGARTLLASSSRSFLEAALGTGDKIETDPTMRAVIERADKKATVWAAGQVPAAIGAGLTKATGGVGSATKSFTIKADFTDGIAVTVTAELASADEATALLAQGEAQIGMIALAVQKHGLGQLVKRVKFSSEDNYLNVSLAATEDELAGLLARIDSGDTTMQNPPAVGSDAGVPSAPPSSPKGEQGNGHRNPASDRQAPVRQ